mmetsp:Transcript_4633/g.8784  ORF Transcript_4633/g.8784 Transcript_4633/m.8784 type:complete len:253 (+) Transcript_4633:88-846(+)
MNTMLGSMLRETGQALDRLGCRIIGNSAFKEQLNRHRTVMNLGEKIPGMTSSTFVAPSASVIGDVKIGAGSSIWYGTILRGDVNSISIGENTNLQDGCVVHVAKHNVGGVKLPTIVGNSVTVGHGAMLHACTVEDMAFVGMGATLLDGSKVEKGAMVAAGALVTAGTTVPSGQIWAGNPAKFLRNLTTEETSFISKSADNYAALAVTHLKENSKPWEQVIEEKAMRKQHRERSEDYDSHLGISRPASAAIPA